MKPSDATNKALYASPYWRGISKSHLSLFEAGLQETVQALQLLRQNPNNVFGYTRVEEWAIVSEAEITPVCAVNEEVVRPANAIPRRLAAEREEVQR